MRTASIFAFAFAATALVLLFSVPIIYRLGPVRPWQGLVAVTAASLVLWVRSRRSRAAAAGMLCGAAVETLFMYWVLAEMSP